jgi:hypothetical protein
MAPGTDFATLVDFALIVTGFSSVIAGSLALKHDFLHITQKEKGLHIFAIISRY